MSSVISDARKVNGKISFIIIPRNILPIFNDDEIFTSNEYRIYY